jgi:phosphotransferase system enzyme I (PtsP)
MAIDRPGMFRYQLRALLHAASGKTLRVMFPLVSTVDEFLQAKELLKKEIQRLKRFGHTDLPAELKIGCMIETPAITWQLDQLLPHTDFISVGANDLMQYFFAADRENTRVSERYDPLHAGAILMLRQIVDAARRYNVPVSICGEMAGRRADAALLLALGFRQLSVTASAIGPLKQLVLSLDIRALSNQLEAWLSENNTDLRKKLLAFAKSEKINL